MGKFFWILAGVGISVVLVSQLFGRGDWAAVQESWNRPQGAIVARGLPPQIELIKEVADDHGWSVDCTRQDEGLTVVQFIPTFWAKFGKVEDFYNEVIAYATSTAHMVAPSREALKCGEGHSIASQEYGSQSEEKESLLAYGTEGELTAYFEMAKRCKFEGFELRELTGFEKEQIGGRINSDWLGLSAKLTEADANQFICVLALSRHAQDRW